MSDGQLSDICLSHFLWKFCSLRYDDFAPLRPPRLLPFIQSVFSGFICLVMLENEVVPT
jgi:hypothetical protein